MTSTAKVSTTSTNAYVPSLNLLPNELILKIFNCCKYREFLALSTTSHFFKRLSKEANLAKILFQTEFAYPNPLPRGMAICHSCLRVLPHGAFEPTELGYGGGGAWIDFRRGGGQAVRRLCLDCGIERGMYLPGESIVYNGSNEFMCWSCNHFCGIIVSDCVPTVTRSQLDSFASLDEIVEFLLWAQRRNPNILEGKLRLVCSRCYILILPRRTTGRPPRNASSSPMSG